MAKKRIAFAMIEAGGGHKMPALAVFESLKRLYPGKYEMTVLDFVKDLGCVDLDQVHKSTWKYLLTHPSLTKGIQTFDFITGPVNMSIYKLAIAPFYPYVQRYLRKEKPDLIFSTHYFNTMAVSHVRRAYGLDTVLVNFLSEIFDFDSYWYLKNVDHYIVTSEQAADKLLRRCGAASSASGAAGRRSWRSWACPRRTAPCWSRWAARASGPSPPSAC